MDSFVITEKYKPTQVRIVKNGICPEGGSDILDLNAYTHTPMLCRTPEGDRDLVKQTI